MASYPLRWKPARVLCFGALALCLGVATVGCKSKKSSGPADDAAPAAPQEQLAQPWNGSLVELLPESTTTWAYIHIGALREDARVLSFFRSLTEENREPMTIALLEADELVVGWAPDAREPLVLLRSSFITPQLRGAIIQGSLGDTQELTPEPYGAHTLSLSPTSGDGMTTPASNLLFTGPKTELQGALDRLANAPATSDVSASAAVVFALAPDPSWGDLAEEAISEPRFAQQIRAITMVSGALQLDGGLSLSSRLSLDDTGEPELAAELFGLALSRVLPQLLSQVVRDDYASHLTNAIRATSQEGAVILRAELPEDEVGAWLNVLTVLASVETTDPAPLEEADAPTQAPTPALPDAP